MNIYEALASNKTITPVIHYTPRISAELKTTVRNYLREGYALAMEAGYVPDSFIANFRTYQIEAVKVLNTVFFVIDGGAFQSFAQVEQTIFILLGGE